MNKINLRRTIAEPVIIAFLVLFPHYVPLPFYSYALVCFLLIVFYLKRQNKTLADVGLTRKGLSVHTFVVGILSAILWMAFIKIVYFPFINHFFRDYISDYTEYDFIKNNIKKLLAIMLAAWVVGGSYEEIVFRGFIQRTMQKWFSNYSLSFWMAGLLTSILFGLYHWQQGIFGVIPATLGGLYWTYLLKRYNGNLWHPIVSHASYDTIALTMIYFGILN
ncbi:CPBP family intramembrane metalloprotease [Hanamia caeni]|uniref:CPBP family intramembrane metalloprotease n=1 Tax=Hanamia caeni TaxID=2294116 RepID=A0A3M9NAL1_9BACT|nr:CPBP family intramembrane glutamic endopeptidase [Hanamia caeni]RNI34824.1 CPBP family intramembrane metalloprotease [Hanamia caeni]